MALRRRADGKIPRFLLPSQAPRHVPPHIVAYALWQQQQKRKQQLGQQQSQHHKLAQQEMEAQPADQQEQEDAVQQDREPTSGPSTAHQVVPLARPSGGAALTAAAGSATPAAAVAASGAPLDGGADTVHADRGADGAGAEVGEVVAVAALQHARGRPDGHDGKS
jgi:hypothetical protein